MLIGEKIWSLVGPLAPKDKTQLEERLRRVTGPSTNEAPVAATASASMPGITRLAAGTARPNSPSTSARIGAIGRPASPAVSAISRLARPASPAHNLRPASPISVTTRSESPAHKPPITQIAQPLSPTGIGRPKSMLPSRLGKPRSMVQPTSHRREIIEATPVNNASSSLPEVANDAHGDNSDDITITISTILSNDPSRSVDALKKVQKILSLGPEAGPSSPQYRELAEHTEGLIETIALQMAHVFEPSENLIPEDNFRLAKHLIQTLNNFCDHAFLAESLTVEILTALLDELTLRLLETDDSPVKRVKDLSRFINMIILRLFATGRRMSIFRCVHSHHLQPRF